MSRLKQGIQIIMIFVLLFAVVGAPLVYMQYQNRHMLNEVRLAPMQPWQTDAKNEIAQDYNIWERIGIINQSVRVSSPFLSAFKDESIANQAIAEIIKAMEKQLTTLHEYHALPDLTFSDVLEASVSKETYTYKTETIRSDLSISVWAIHAEYESFHVYVYMDTKISALYDVTIQSKKNYFIYGKDISENGFLEYLQTFSPIPDVQEREEMYTAYGSYMGKTVALYLYSVNKETNKFTEYKFNERNKIDIGIPYGDMPNISVSDSDIPNSSTSDSGK